MDFLKKFWPLSFNRKEVKDLVIAVVVYVLAPSVFNVVFGTILHLSILVGTLGSLVDLYCTAGCVFAFLNFFKVGPFKD